VNGLKAANDAKVKKEGKSFSKSFAANTSEEKAEAADYETSMGKASEAGKRAEVALILTLILTLPLILTLIGGHA